MALSFSNITELPEPPLKTSPSNFAERADTFLDALPDFVVETNEVIDELNTLTSGLDQQTPIDAYEATTSYDFPDVVACTDGYSYRCIGSGIVGVDPMTDDGTTWVCLTQTTAATGELQIGDVKIAAVDSVPSGFLACNGAELSRTTYADLYAAIGTTWGEGDGSTTFNIPDFEDEFLRGDSATSNVGDTVEDSLESHTHTGATDSDSHSHSYTKSGFSASSSSDGLYNDYGASVSGTTGSDSHSHSVTINATGDDETAPRHAVVKYLIRYE